MSLFEILIPSQVRLDLAAHNQAEAISATTNLLSGSPHILDFPGFEEEVIAREKLSATAVGNGVAFPHARTRHVERIVMAAGRCAQDIPFDEGRQPVRMIFVIGTPTNMVREYLGIVGDLARRLKHETVRRKLLEAANPTDFLAALKAASKD